MPILSAEIAFRKGLVALVGCDSAQALTHFEEAMRIELQRRAERPQMRYLSYYGLSVAQAYKPTPEAIQACETAVRNDFFNPDLELNLGKVYLLAGKTTRALAALERGLRMAPGHAGLLAELRKAERRAPLPIPWIRRSHSINQWLGRFRASFASRTSRWIHFRRIVSPP